MTCQSQHVFRGQPRVKSDCVRMLGMYVGMCAVVMETVKQGLLREGCFVPISAKFRHPTSASLSIHPSLHPLYTNSSSIIVLCELFVAVSIKRRSFQRHRQAHRLLVPSCPQIW